MYVLLFVERWRWRLSCFQWQNRANRHLMSMYFCLCHQNRVALPKAIYIIISAPVIAFVSWPALSCRTSLFSRFGNMVRRVVTSLRRGCDLGLPDVHDSSSSITSINTAEEELRFAPWAILQQSLTVGQRPKKGLLVEFGTSPKPPSHSNVPYIKDQKEWGLAYERVTRCQNESGFIFLRKSAQIGGVHTFLIMHRSYIDLRKCTQFKGHIAIYTGSKNLNLFHLMIEPLITSKKAPENPQEPLQLILPAPWETRPRLTSKAATCT